ncbi:hypothetical protein ASZ90_006852 [hydrocarbon metagenome]|uniref:Uncharacterized protein n=1 Tax=hydrocarbon metagenome TaxID=938273 RepID=A0A0W8FR30_9ZZZZ
MEEDKVDLSVTMNALWNAFPSVASFIDFKETDREVSVRAIPRIIKFAYKNNIIPKETEKAFIEFLAGNKNIDIDKPLPEELTFSDVVDALCGSSSVNSLIMQLEKITKELSLPIIKATMITRLKKHFILNTAKQRSLLRILAYRLAQKRPDLNWHYEMLSKITIGSAKADTAKEKVGVTITLHLQGKGEIITPVDINWLKIELSKCIEYLNLVSHISNKNIISSGAAAFSLKLPKKQGPMEQPRLYDRAIRDSLAIAHQMAVRWLLCEYSSPQKKLVVIIHAGLVAETNLIIQPLLETKLTGETGIYLTDYARLCARVAEVKVGFERYKNNSLADESNISDIWAVKYFMSYNYYTYIPYLLEEKMLPIHKTAPSYIKFQQALYFPEMFSESPFEALRALQHFPHSSLLLIEIAKVLRGRQMLYEAETIISNILLSDPRNVIARLVRMLTFENIAHINNDFFTSELAFERAIAESEFIVRRCHNDEISWNEIGLLYYGRAKRYVNYLRSDNASDAQNVTKEDVLNNFQKAKEYFLKALVASPAGKDGTAMFFYACTLCLIELFSSGEKLFDKRKYAFLTDNHNIFKKVAICFFTEIGWLRNYVSPEGNINESSLHVLLLALRNGIARFENSILAEGYIPYVKYAWCILFWDLVPCLTVGTCKYILDSLNEARIRTEKLIKDNLSVYQMSIGYIPPDKFLALLQEATDIVNKYITADDLKKDDNTFIDQTKFKELSKIKFTLLEIDRY